MAQKKLSIINFSAPFANCPSSGGSCSFYNFPTNEMNTIRSHGAIPFYSWASQSIPSTTNEPNFQLSDVIAGTYDSYIRKFADRRQGLGTPLLPALQLGDERALVPLVGGRQRQQVRRIRHRLAPRPRHLHLGRRDQRDLGLVPEHRPQRRIPSTSPASYPGNAYVDWTGLDGYNWGTNPAKPDRWRSFDQLYSSTYDKITGTIAPVQAADRSARSARPSTAARRRPGSSDALAKIPTSYPKIRGLLWFEQFDDGMDWPIETSTSATSAFAEGIQNPAYADNNFGALPFGAILPPS